MKFTTGWLAEHLETEASLDEIVGALTDLGLEVEGVSDPAATLAAFTTARVLEARPHPDADRLRVCTVETKDGIFEVVCGAPNARTGMIGVFAPAGAYIPGTATKLRKSKIRGIESNGMLVSEREMGLSDEHEGIIELDQSVPIGEPFAKVLGLDDPVIDVAITPNRQDCLGVQGIARDLAAAGVGAFKETVIAPTAGVFESPIGVSLKFSDETRDACPYFVGRAIRGVKNGPSPAWLQQRLLAVGLRPISALVDMTNYMTLSFARPLHVFDGDKVHGGLHVRLSRAGEQLLALDGKAYELDDAVTVIADEGGALAMGGVIGGEASACTPETTTVFIESALFDPVRTAATGRRYQVESDARYRFERGVDPEFTEPGIEEATRLVLELCGGEPSALVIAGDVPEWRRTVTLRDDRTAKLGGIEVAAEEQVRILGALGFGVKTEGSDLEVAVPSWRSDIHGEPDLVEEITRVLGFDAIAPVPFRGASAVAQPVLRSRQRRARAAKRALAARGLLEAVTWSFTSARLAALFGGGAETLRLANPISSELDAMRPSALPNLMAAGRRNLDRGAEDFGLFEVGPYYTGTNPEDQATEAAGVRFGMAEPRQWSAGARDVDAYDAKADALAALEASGAPMAKARVEAGGSAWFHPGRSGTVRLGPAVAMATFGEFHPSVLAAMDLSGPAAGFQVFLDAVPGPKAKRKTAKSGYDAPDLPAVVRDFAFLVEAGVVAADITGAAGRADPKIAGVTLFDVFTGTGVAEGRKSIAIAVRLQPTETTFTDVEIDAIAERIVAAVAKATGAELRT